MKARWFVFSALLLLMACGGGGPTPPDTSGRAVLPETTKILDADGTAALSGVTPAGRLTFTATSAVLAELEIGDVLVIGVGDLTPDGALRTVVDIAPQGAGLVLETEPALLQDAFEELELSLETTITASADLARQQDGITFPFELTASDAGGEIGLRGSLAVAPEVDLTLDIDIVAFRLEEMTLSFGARETFLATLSGRGEQTIDESIDLGTIPFAPIILYLPTPTGTVLPVVLTPQVVISAGIRGSATGDVEAGVLQEAEFSAGLGYRDGAFGGFSDSDSSFEFDEPSYGATASVRAEAGPRLEVLLYGAVGPFAEAAAYVELGASVEGPPPCVRGIVDAGLTVRAGVDLLADYETTLLNEAYPIASFDSCDSSPGRPRPVPTWTRFYGRVGSPGDRAGAVIEVSDGTFLAVGGSNLFDGITGSNASLWAMRLDARGNILWQKAYGGLAAGYARAVREVPGGFVIATSLGLLRIDTGGNVRWARRYEGSGYLEIASLVADADGGVVVAGRYGNDVHSWAARLGTGGEVLWSRRYGGTGFSSLRAVSDGGYIAVGGSDTNNGDAYLVRLDAGGEPLWQRTIDNRYDSTGGAVPDATKISGGDYGMDVAERPGGGFVVAGQSYGSFPVPEPSQAGHYEAWVFEVDGNGEVGTSTVYRAPPDANYTTAYAVAVRPGGTPIVLGRRADEASDLLSNEDILILQGGAASALGTVDNDTIYAGVLGRGSGMPIGITADGGALVVATTSLPDGEVFWLVRLNRTGNSPGQFGLSAESLETTEDVVAFEISPPTAPAPLAGDAIDVPVEITPVREWQLGPVSGRAAR